MAVPRTQFYHPAKVIDTAMHAIDRAIRRAEGIALVVGPPGTGKSLLLAKVAESVAEDFRVTLLSGARICTRRALWQSILADLGMPYRGIDEAELRIAVAEEVRRLAAVGSGLVILVDEAHTLPLRLIEELRLLANMPTPLPAVHVVLAGPAALEERLTSPKMESFAQRIAVRAYLEPLDHAETVAYLRTQTKAAGLDWDACFEPGCEDAVYSAADGVPRVMNQLCDQALVHLAGARRRVSPSDIAAAWNEIQRLPSPAAFSRITAGETFADAAAVGDGVDHARSAIRDEPDSDMPFAVASGGFLVHEYGGEHATDGIEFGQLDDDPSARPMPSGPERFSQGEDADMTADIGPGVHQPVRPGMADPWRGPDVEFVFEASTDPFQEFFEQEERVVERYAIRSPGDLGHQQHLSGFEGAALVRRLAELADHRSEPFEQLGGGASRDAGPPPPGGSVDSEARGTPPHGAATVTDTDDSDMVVIEEDLFAQASVRPTFAAVRLGDYRRLFARLRRGG